jgi:hypothetical protein
MNSTIKLEKRQTVELKMQLSIIIRRTYNFKYESHVVSSILGIYIYIYIYIKYRNVMYDLIDMINMIIYDTRGTY